jgi:hypothetical protein
VKPELMPTSPIRDEADRLLRILAADTAALAAQQEKLAEAVRLVSEVFEADIANKQRSIADAAAALRKLALDHQDEFFPAGRDLATLPSGVIQLKITTRVKQARSVLKRLLELGMEKFLKRSVSVNWDAMKYLSDAELGGLGTERITETDISFQLPEAETAKTDRPKR